MCLGFFVDHFSLDAGHFEIVLFPLDHLLQFNFLNFEVRLCFDNLLSLFSHLFLKLYLFLLGCNEEVDLNLLHFFKVFLDPVWNFGLGDSN